MVLIILAVAGTFALIYFTPSPQTGGAAQRYMFAGIFALFTVFLIPNSPRVYVTRLLTLYSQARRSNAGTRGLDEIGRLTYVRTRLDDQLAPAIADGSFRLVIVTGNAGDGKTVIVEIEKRGPTREGVDQLRVETKQDGDRIEVEVKRPAREVVFFDGENHLPVRAEWYSRDELQEVDGYTKMRLHVGLSDGDFDY